ncbi:hypothetical protein RE2895_12890 [Rhodococcus erythropolis]|nr:hypothetical protein RE2895_12890 [Rhodococcus erythropolis]
MDNAPNPIEIGYIGYQHFGAASTWYPSPPCGYQVGGGDNPPCSPPPSSTNPSFASFPEIICADAVVDRHYPQKLTIRFGADNIAPVQIPSPTLSFR